MNQVTVRIKREPFLKLLRQKKISQNALGWSLGLTSGYVSQLVNGKRNVKPQTLATLLSVLGVPFAEIFEEHFYKR
jgi:transcriptional regulator with XRE-family HTH domain